MRFGLRICFVSLLVSVGLAQGPKKPMLIATCANRQASYAAAETVNLTVRIENRGKATFYFYRPLEWGWTGLWYGIIDAKGNPVPHKLPIMPLPPPPVSNRSEFVELEPGYIYGRHVKLALSEYDLKPGTYSIVFKYRSYHRAGDGFGLPILTWDDGEIVANRIEISIHQ